MDDVSLQIMRLAGQGYCCSQMLILFALEAQGRENPELVRAVAGLCNGLGDCSGTCGVLAGAACALSMYSAKGGDQEQEHERHPLLISSLGEWFRQRTEQHFGGSRCCDILGGDCSGPNPERCGALISEAWGKCLEILAENGIDPTEPTGGEHA